MTIRDVPTYPTAAQAATMKGLFKLTRADRISTPYYICGEWCNNPPDQAINPTASTIVSFLSDLLGDAI